MARVRCSANGQHQLIFIPDEYPLMKVTTIRLSFGSTQLGRSSMLYRHFLKNEKQPIEIDLYGNTHIFKLINLLHQLTEKMMLIWDDFHVVKDSSILNGLSYLLEHIPPHVHFVISSRTQPPLPISRLNPFLNKKESVKWFVICSSWGRQMKK